jgi:hypothetical protein
MAFAVAARKPFLLRCTIFFISHASAARKTAVPEGTAEV